MNKNKTISFDCLTSMIEYNKRLIKTYPFINKLLTVTPTNPNGWTRLTYSVIN